MALAVAGGPFNLRAVRPNIALNRTVSVPVLLRAPHAPVNLIVSPLTMPKIDISTLSAAELDELIAGAAKLRQALKPAVALEPPQTSEATNDPAWRSMMHGDNTVLQLRHLGVGWVTVIIPPHERASLLTLFLRQALSPPPAQAAVTWFAARDASCEHWRQHSSLVVCRGLPCAQPDGHATSSLVRVDAARRLA